MDIRTATNAIAPLGQIGMQILQADRRYQNLLAKHLAAIGKPLEQLTIKEVLQALRDTSVQYEEKQRGY